MTYIRLHVGAKRLVFHLSPQDGHVIIVSGCLILTAVNLIILIWISNITDSLVSSFARYIVTFDIGLHGVCVRVGVRYVITKFSRMDSLPNFVTHGAPLKLYNHPGWLFELLYIVLITCFLIGLAPTGNFGNQRYLQISYPSASK